MERIFYIFLIYIFLSHVESLCLPVVWSESHNFQFMHRQKTSFFTFLKQSFFWIRSRVFNTFWINASNTRMSMFWDLYNLCIDIWTFAVDVDSTKYWWRNVRHPISITCDAFFGNYWHSACQNSDDFAFHQKVKIVVFCLCIVWEKWDFDRNANEQQD